MKNALKFSIASVIVTLATLAMVAGSAVAQPKISGGVAAGFGILSWDNGTDSGSTYNAQTESNLIASGTNGSFDYYYRIRIRGTQGDTVVKGGTEGSFNDGQLQTVRTRVTWNINDSLSIAMGRLPGIGVINPGYTSAMRAPSGMRSADGNIAGWDTGGMVVAYKAGAIRAGLAILTNCQVDCSAGAATGYDVTTGYTISDGNQSTMIPFVQYKAGAIGVGLRMAMASGDLMLRDDGSVSGTAGQDDADETVSSSGTNLDVSFKTDAFAIGLENYSYTAGCVGSGCTEGEGGATVIKVAAAGASLGISMATTVDGYTDPTSGKVSDSTDTVTTINYTMDMGGGKIAPEYISYSNNNTDMVGSLIRLVLKTGF